MSTMTIEQSFEAKAPMADVYAFLNDPERCFPCLPGATFGSFHDDGKFDGKITVQVGPVKVSYDGWALYEEEDPENGRLVLSGQGREKGGAGIVKMNMTCQLVEENGVTRTDVVAEVGLAGRIVRLGRGMVKGVSAEVFREFSDRARAQLEGGAGGAAAPSAADPFGGSPAEDPADAATEPAPSARTGAPAAPEPAAPANGLAIFFRALRSMIGDFFSGLFGRSKT